MIEVHVRHAECSEQIVTPEENALTPFVSEVRDAMKQQVGQRSDKSPTKKSDAAPQPAQVVAGGTRASACGVTERSFERVSPYPADISQVAPNGLNA
jgi:hypothetical protein